METRSRVQYLEGPPSHNQSSHEALKRSFSAPVARELFCVVEVDFHSVFIVLNLLLKLLARGGVDAWLKPLRMSLSKKPGTANVNYPPVFATLQMRYGIVKVINSDLHC